MRNEAYEAKIIAEAEQAKALWENQLLRQIVKEMRDRLIEQWRNSKPEEVELRERCYLKLQVLDEVAATIFEKIAALALIEKRDQAIKAVT